MLILKNKKKAEPYLLYQFLSFSPLEELNFGECVGKTIFNIVHPADLHILSAALIERASKS
jgi:hypothetical protein